MNDGIGAAYVDAAAALLGLSIESYRDGVLRYFVLAAEMNAVVEAYPLTARDESGEAFALATRSNGVADAASPEPKA